MLKLLRFIKRRFDCFWAFWWRLFTYFYFVFHGAQVVWPGPFVDLLPRIYKAKGARLVIGRDCLFVSGFKLNPAGISRRVSLAVLEGGLLSIGSSVKLSGVAICAVKSITIGDNVMLGLNSSVYDTDFHPLDPLARRNQQSIFEALCSPVEIEADAWLGAHVMVLKGVCVGRGAMVAAGSIVTRSVPAGMLAAGVPCRVIRPI